eukprot:6465724-Amphidinium_carterae.1
MSHMVVYCYANITWGCGVPAEEGPEASGSLGKEATSYTSRTSAAAWYLQGRRSIQPRTLLQGRLCQPAGMEQILTLSVSKD